MQHPDVPDDPSPLAVGHRVRVRLCGRCAFSFGDTIDTLHGRAENGRRGVIQGFAPHGLGKKSPFPDHHYAVRFDVPIRATHACAEEWNFFSAAELEYVP